MRVLRHPGPAAKDRAIALPCHATRLRVVLRAGVNVTDAAAAALGAAGYRAGWLRLDGAILSLLRYVIPAPATGNDRAAWYSDEHQMPGPARILRGGAHLGERDGAPFLHAHGIWQADASAAAMGHLLPAASVLAEDAEIDAIGISGAHLSVAHDDETGFDLFRPEPDPAPAGPANARLITLRPNQDIVGALDGLDLGDAAIMGIGSLVGTEFAGGRSLTSHANEVLVTGSVTSGQAKVHADAVGFDGAFDSGELVRGKNAICITAELLVVEEPL